MVFAVELEGAELVLPSPSFVRIGMVDSDVRLV